MSSSSNVHLWRTSITKVTPEDIIIRGTDIRSLIRSNTITEAAFLTVRRRFPTPAETRMLDAALCALVDHGFCSSHVTAARFIVSGHPNVIAGLAGGLLTAGPNTLSPESAGQYIDRALARKRELGTTLREAAATIVAETAARGERIPGIGHVTHKELDPRTPVLRSVAEETGFLGERVTLYEALHAEFERSKKKHLPINADGMLAAILGDMGFSPMEMAGLAVFAALPGMLAHVIEEITTGAPHRYLPDEQVSYFDAPADAPIAAPTNSKGASK